jgi:selenocysteine-specific elongation factor
VRELVKDSFLADAPIVPVSVKTGRGMDDLRRALLERASGIPARHAEGVVRLPVDRVFSVKGFGTVVTGTLTSGTVREEQDLVALPGDRTVKVRGLHVHGRREAEAIAGQRVAVNISGLEVSELSRGATLCERGSFEVTRRLDVRFELLRDARALRHGARVRFHSGTSELLGRVAVSSTDSGAGSPSEVQPGMSAFARIRLEAPAVATRGDRFILRAYSPPVTIGGGVVLDPYPPRGAIRTPAGIDRFRRLDARGHQPEDAVSVFIEERGGAGLPRTALVGRAGLTPGAAEEMATSLVSAGRAVAVEDLLVAPAALRELEETLVSDLRVHHGAHPLSEGVPREEARVRLFGRAADAVFGAVLQRLVGAGRIVARDRLALADYQVSLSPEEAGAQEGLTRVYRDAGLAPPDVATAAVMAGTSQAIAERVLKLLLRSRTLVRIDTLVFHVDALERLKADVRGLKGQGGAGRVDVAAFKERYGVTRKYAIPLLEYLDRERVTRRVGESRVVL